MMNNEVPITASTSKGVVTMKNVVPYDRIARNLSTWPFGSFDSFFDAPYSALSSVSSDAFVMNVEDAGQSYVVTTELPGVSKENTTSSSMRVGFQSPLLARSLRRRRPRTTCTKSLLSGRQLVAYI